MTSRSARALQALDSSIQQLRSVLDNPTVLAAASSEDWYRGYRDIVALKATLTCVSCATCATNEQRRRPGCGRRFSIW
jgi:hypothetical protein